MTGKLIAAVALAASMAGAGTVLAGHGPGFPPPGMDGGAGGGVLRMAAALKLTEAQKSRIKTVLDDEREEAGPLLDSMREKRKLLQAAADATTFDEAAVRSIAVAQARAETELIVSRTRTQSRINAILTAEQRELLKNLRPVPDKRPLPPDAGD